MQDIHKDLKRQYAEDAEKYENPWVLWEMAHVYSSSWFATSVGSPRWENGIKYRRKSTCSVTGLVPKVKGHPHAELMAQYAEDAKTNPEPWKLWEYRNSDTSQWVEFHQNPIWHERSRYRRKPQTTKRYVYTRLAYNSLGGTDLYTAQFDNCNPENLEHRNLVGYTIEWAEPEWNIREVTLEGEV